MHESNCSGWCMILRVHSFMLHMRVHHNVELGTLLHALASPWLARGQRAAEAPTQKWRRYSSREACKLGLPHVLNDYPMILSYVAFSSLPGVTFVEHAGWRHCWSILGGFIQSDQPAKCWTPPTKWAQQMAQLGHTRITHRLAEGYRYSCFRIAGTNYSACY